MKILKIFLIIILVLFIAGTIGAYIFLKTLDVDKYKPQIIAFAKQSLHRDLDFKDMDLNVSLTSGVKLKLIDLSISEDPAFSKGAFLTVNNVSLGIDILSFLLKKEVQISRVVVDSPKVSIIRNTNGAMNVETIAKKSVIKIDDVIEPSADSSASDQPSPIAGLPAIFIEGISIRGGTFSFIDQSSSPERNVTVSDFEFNVDQFSFEKSFDFTSEGSFLSAENNFKVSGQAAINPSTTEINLKNVTVSTDLSKIILEDLKRSFGLSKDMPLPSKLGGIFEIMIKDLKAGPQGLASMALDANFKDGIMALQNISPGISLDVSQIQMQVNDLSLTESFKFSVSAAVFSDQTNLNAHGNVKIDAANQSADLQNTVIFSDLSYFSFEKLKNSLTMLKEGELPQALGGKLNLDVRQMTVGATGLKSLAVNGDLIEGSAKLKQFAVPIGLQTKFSATEAELIVPEFTSTIGKGNLNGQLTVSDYLGQQNFSGQFKINKVDLAEVLDPAAIPVKVEGFVDGNYSFQGQGFSPEALEKTLAAEGGIELKNGRIKDINILKVVLSKLSMLPNVVSKIEAALPPRYKDKLLQNDTVLNVVTVKTTIRDGVVKLDPVSVDADGFLFSALGQYSLSQQISMKGIMVIPEDLSASMITGAQELKLFLNGQNQIEIPVAVVGKLPDGLRPDLEFIGKRLLQNQGKAELNKVLDKVFDRKTPATQDENESQKDQPPSERPEDQMINTIIDNIFK